MSSHRSQSPLSGAQSQGVAHTSNPVNLEWNERHRVWLQYSTRDGEWLRWAAEVNGWVPWLDAASQLGDLQPQSSRPASRNSSTLPRHDDNTHNTQVAGRHPSEYDSSSQVQPAAHPIPSSSSKERRGKLTPETFNANSGPTSQGNLSRRVVTDAANARVGGSGPTVAQVPLAAFRPTTSLRRYRSRKDLKWHPKYSWLVVREDQEEQRYGEPV